MYAGVGNGGCLWDGMSRGMAEPRQVSWLVFAGVGWTGVSFNGMNEKMKKMNDNVHRGSFSGHTGRTSHTLDPPSCISLPHSSIE